MQEKNFLEAERLLRTSNVQVAFDDAVAVCALKDVAYGVFLKKLQKELGEQASKTLTRKNALAKIMKNGEAEPYLNAFADAIDYVCNQCALVWQIEGMPSDFILRLNMPMDPFQWYDPLIWDLAILNYLHPACDAHVPLAVQAWEQKTFGKKPADKNVRRSI